MGNAISVSKLSFSYSKENSLLEDVSFDIDNGGIYAIFGPNGCGKTTLLKCLLNLLKYQGTVALFNKDIRSISHKELAESIAFVPQFINLPTNFYVRDYIILGLATSLKFYQSPSKDDYKAVDEVSQKLGLMEIVNKKMDELSGGEAQIVSVARALVQDSKVIILDEPMASLDFGNQGRLLKLIKQINSEGKTIIFTTHNPNHINFLNCNTIVMRKGKIVKTSKGLDKETVESLYDDVKTINNEDSTAFIWKD